MQVRYANGMSKGGNVRRVTETLKNFANRDMRIC